MSKKLITDITERIVFCYKKKENSWSTKGNIIDVMKMDEFKFHVFENCKTIANVFYENFGNDSFLELDEISFYEAYLPASRTIEATTIVTIAPSKELRKSPEELSWLNNEKVTELGWDNETNYVLGTYRNRYFEYLQREKGWKSDVLDDLKFASLKVVKGLGDPNDSNAFFVRGMVLGSVQSGKTTNFNAVINSAIDLGYQLIIVFCGTIEDLRGQTYQRISTDVVGGWEEDDSIRKKTGKDFKGVSNIYNFSANEKQVNLITGPSKSGDFNSSIAAANFNPNAYNIAVCKKNVSIIKNLLQWLNQYPQARNLPTLIIDDECDNASLNNNGNNADTNPSQINAGIRALLNMFHKKTYLGYTATPFANILQFDGAESSFSWKKGSIDFSFDCCVQDLFPEDFIQLLSPPSNYVGIKDFFDTRDPNIEKIEGLIETIPKTDVNECFPLRVIQNGDFIFGTDSRESGTRASKKEDPFPSYLPDSLKDAIKCFVLSIALRYSRNKEQEHFPLFQKHHSMLIHISRYTQWIDRTKKLVQEYLDSIEPETRAGNITSSIYIELESTWNKYFLYQVENIPMQLTNRMRNDPYLTARDFDTVRRYLPSAIKDIDIVAIHSKSNDELKYSNSNGNKYIAIGGNALSRGFTLEGLAINYFVRGTNNADTLMQMGRWFGYRPGYLDACKLFTTSEAIERFDEASLIIEDLENKLDDMIREGKSPREFTIWVRDNPDVIRLTRPNLLKNLHELTLDFNDKLQQSTQFFINKNKIDFLYNNFKNYIRSVSNDWVENGSFVLSRNIPPEKIIEAINLSGLKDVLVNLNIAGLDNFIKQANSKGLLNNWTIAISFNKGGDNQEIDLLSEFGIDLSIQSKLIRRSLAKDRGSINRLLNGDIFKAIKSTIISPSDLGLTFSRQELEKIKIDFLANNPNAKTVPESAYREKLSENEGLLIFYLIDPKYIIEDDKLKSDFPIEYKEFIQRNDLVDFKTPLVGCAIGLPRIRSVQTSNFVTRRIIQLPSEMSFDSLIDKCGGVGSEISKCQDIVQLNQLRDKLGIDLEIDDEVTILQYKKLLLIEYLENGNN